MGANGSMVSELGETFPLTLIADIIKKYHPDWIVKDKPATDGGNGISGQDQTESESHEPQQTPPKKPGDKKGGGGATVREVAPNNRRTTPLPKPEVKPNEPS